MKKNSDSVVITFNEKSMFLTVRNVDGDRVFFRSALGEMAINSIPLGNALKRYPGYVEWIIARVKKGNMELPTVTAFRNETGKKK